MSKINKVIALISVGIFLVSANAYALIKDQNVDPNAAIQSTKVDFSKGVTATAGATISGAAINLNKDSNYAVNVGTGTCNAAVSIGGGSNTVAINSSDWDIGTTGIMTGIGAITSDGLLTATLGALISGATISLNNDSNFNVNLCTGTSTGTVSVGGASALVTVGGVIQGTSPLVFEGTTANNFETTLALTDPTADNTITLPNYTGTVLLSSTANEPDTANAFWVNTGDLKFEGSIANAFETTVTVTDPTVARTITIPDATGTVDVLATASHDYAGAAVAWAMNVNEARASYVVVTNANGAVDAVLPAAIPGKIYLVLNTSGQTLTFKVTGQTGGTIASTKFAVYMANATDVVEIMEQS